MSKNRDFDLTLFFQVWTKLASNIRVRDRLVKVLQYGCQMLVSYYGHLWSEERVKALSLLRRTSSTSRKAFWLLKSVNHLGELVNRTDIRLLDPDASWVDKFDYIEQICLAVYYHYESMIYFCRTNILKPEYEALLDPGCNWSWFLGDLAYLCSTTLKLSNNYFKMISLVDRAKKLSFSIADLPSVEQPIMATVPTSIPERKRTISACDSEESQSILSELCELNATKTDDVISVLIALFEIGASAHYVGLWRLLFGQDIKEGHVGLMGVLSSSLIIFDNARRELKKC